MGEQELYRKFARYYDLIYEWVDYSAEAEFIKTVVDQYKNSDGQDLLEVACGTGNHTKELVDTFHITAVDLNPEMIEIASKKLPQVEFHLQDMKQLQLGKKFDTLICLFSAINYHKDLDSIQKTLNLFHAHLKYGGVLIFDLGFSLENWEEGRVSVDTVVEDNLQLARICQSQLRNGVFNANFVFLVKEEGKIDFEIDQHQIGVFRTREVLDILEGLGFDCLIYDGFFDLPWDETSGERPVFVCIKPDRR